MEQKLVRDAELSPEHREEFVKHLSALRGRYGAGAVLIAKTFHKAQVSAQKLLEDPLAPPEDRRLASEALAAAVADFTALLAVAFEIPDEKICACVSALAEFEQLISEDILGMSGVATESELQEVGAIVGLACDRARRAGL